MNFALSTLLMTLLLLPAFFFSCSFYQEDLKYNSLTRKTILCIFMLTLLHPLYLFIINKLLFDINIKKFLILMSGKNNSQFSNVINSIELTEVIKFSIYLSILYAVFFGLGVIGRSIIKKHELEKFIFFRIEKPWYYLLTGYDRKKNAPDGILVAAVVELSGKNYLYIGWLKDYFFNENGDLDLLILDKAQRRDLNQDKELTEEKPLSSRFYPIDGDDFILKYTNIKNLNLKFASIELLN